MRAALCDPAFRTVLLLFLLDRLALEAVGWIAGLRVPGGLPPQRFPLPHASPALDMWIRWDSQWFLEIARRGYWLADGRPAPQVFFPLYPLLMRALAPLFAGQLHLAGLFISNAASLAALALLYALVRERWGAEAAARSAAYLVIFPTSFYLSALYSEGLFLALVAGAFLCAARGRWLSAGALGMGAALTRNLGVWLLPALAWEVAARRLSSTERARALLALFLIPAGLALYMAYLRVTTGDPLAFVHGEQRWGRVVVAPWQGLGQALANVLRPPPPAPRAPGRYLNAYRPWYRRLYSALDLAALGLFAGLALAGWRLRLPGSQLLFLAAGLLLPLSAPALGSMTPLPSMWRYVAVLFPGLVSLALLGRQPLVDRAVWVVFPILQSLFFVLFTTWNWIA